MQIRRGRPERFTQVPNTTVDDPKLDVVAVGLLTILLRYPDGWSTDIDQIARKRGPSRHRLYPAMRTLVEAGYVVKVKYQNEAGRWATDVYTFDTPAEPNEVADLLVQYQGARALRVEPTRFKPATDLQGLEVGRDLGKRTGEETNSQVTPTSTRRQVGNRQVGFPAAPKKTDKNTPPPQAQTETPPEEEEDQHLNQPPPGVIHRGDYKQLLNTPLAEKDDRQVDDTPVGNGHDSTGQAREEQDYQAVGDRLLDAVVEAWRPHLGPRSRDQLAPKVIAALAAGHSSEVLIGVLTTNRYGVRNPAAVLSARLDDLPEPRHQAGLPAWCEHCEAPDHRWIEDPDSGLPAPCPTCSPQKGSSAT